MRRGQLAAQVRLRDARVSGGAITLAIMRSGTESVYGDVIATETATGKVVGQLRGIAVLATNNRRNVAIPLTAAAKGAVAIEYRERAQDGGKVLDKTSIIL